MERAIEVTRLLQKGDRQSLKNLFPLVYSELREMAGALFQKEFRSGHTLQPTALVHETYLKLVGNENNISWQNRAHFFGIAARSMRQILVDYARARNREKRGSGQTLIALENAINLLTNQDIEILVLHEALEKLAHYDERLAQIVELKFLRGLTNKETAEILKISTSTVDREWEMARTWLYKELKSEEKK